VIESGNGSLHIDANGKGTVFWRDFFFC